MTICRGQAYAIFLRSPHAHARIRSIDTRPRKRAGRARRLYREDYADDGLGMPKANMPRKKADGRRCSRRSGPRW